MTTDGEPMEHLESGRPVFGYPATSVNISKNLRTVRNCTTKNNTINTFTLDKSYYLKAFVEQMTRINGGRTFYTEPQNLGQYIVVDYVQNKKKKLTGRLLEIKENKRLKRHRRAESHKFFCFRMIKLNLACMQTKPVSRLEGFFVCVKIAAQYRMANSR